ncbi:persephin [Oryzias melastigma]|uniref:persephin n=1 Tax=Oryzias melastigma TaxID=30732 RepID=UPI00168CD7B5|nr:persephin [Oryzias melastigma]
MSPQKLQKSGQIAGHLASLAPRQVQHHSHLKRRRYDGVCFTLRRVFTMRSLIKLILILFCVQRGQGRWLRSLIELVFWAPGHQKLETASTHSSDEDRRSRHPAVEDAQVEASFIPVTPLRTRRSPLDSHCGLRSVLLQVRDLGLGYDSDESVLFKYCSGSCPHTRSNHDLTLNNLLLSGLLPRPPPGEVWHKAPCCRPTHHEDMAFLDNSHRWHKVEKLSAAGCSCVG